MRGRRRLLMTIAFGLAVMFLASPPLVSLLGSDHFAAPVGLPPSRIAYQARFWRHSSGRRIGLDNLGNLLLLESPLGHNQLAFHRETWVICQSSSSQQLYSGLSEATVQARSWSLSEPGGSDPDRARLMTKSVLVVTMTTLSSDGLLQIAHRFKWKPAKDLLEIRMTVKPLLHSVTLQEVKRWADWEVDGSANAANNWWGRTRQSVFAWNDPTDVSDPTMLIMRGLSAPQPPENCYIDTGDNGYTTCASTGTDNGIQGDYAGIVQWSYYAALDVGQSATFKLVYEIRP